MHHSSRVNEAKPTFNKKQKKVIKEAAQMIINAIIKLASNEYLDEQEMLLIIHGLDRQDLLETLAEMMIDWDLVHNNPNLLVELKEERLSTFKHVLFNFVSSKKWPKSKPQVFGKIFMMEDFKDHKISLN